MRLNKYLASAGEGSRRGVEQLIVDGRVRINGIVITDLSTKVGPEDVVKVGSRVVRAEPVIVAVLNKPRGYVCSAEDEMGRRTIFELLPPRWPRVFHVGRLDMESEGLLLITNDGELANILTHPRHKVEKQYEVGLDKAFEPALREKLLRGMMIEGGRAKADRVEVLAPTVLRVTLRQGLKRQIRDMLYRLGYDTQWLRRTRIGPIAIGDLPRGSCRLLNPREVRALKGEAEKAKARPAASSRKAPARGPRRGLQSRG